MREYEHRPARAHVVDGEAIHVVLLDDRLGPDVELRVDACEHHLLGLQRADEQVLGALGAGPRHLPLG